MNPETKIVMQLKAALYVANELLRSDLKRLPEGSRLQQSFAYRISYNEALIQAKRSNDRVLTDDPLNDYARQGIEDIKLLRESMKEDICHT